jgi:hypothetical protein
MSTNQNRTESDTRLKKELDIFGAALRKELLNETDKRLAEFGIAIRDIQKIIETLTADTPTVFAPNTTTPNTAASIAALATTTLPQFFSKPRTRVSSNTQESNRSRDEQNKFRASRTQQLHDASAQLSAGEKNA